MAARIFVGKLSSRTGEQDLQEIFGKFGEVTKVEMKNNFAFVFFREEVDAQEAISSMDGREIDGQTIVVESARNKHEMMKQRPVKRLDLRLTCMNLDGRISWQDLKDWAREAGDVTFTNIFIRDGQHMGVIEFADFETMENALRVLPDVPLKGIHVTLEKEDPEMQQDQQYHRNRMNNRDFRGGDSGGYPPQGRGPRDYDGPPRGFDGGYRGGHGGGGGGGMRDNRDRFSDRGGAPMYEARDRYQYRGPPVGYDGPPGYRGPQGYRGPPGDDWGRSGGGYEGRNMRRGPPMDGPPGGGGYYRDRSRSRSRSPPPRDRGGDRFYGGSRGMGMGMGGGYRGGGGGGGGGGYGPPSGGGYHGSGGGGRYYNEGGSRGGGDRGGYESRGPR